MTQYLIATGLSSSFFPFLIIRFYPISSIESLTLASLPPTTHGKEFLYFSALKACCYSFPEQTFFELTAQSILVQLESPRTTSAKSCELRSSSNICSIFRSAYVAFSSDILEINLCLFDGKWIKVACALLCSAVLYCILSKTRFFVSCCCFDWCTLSRNLFILRYYYAYFINFVGITYVFLDFQLTDTWKHISS